MVYDRRSYKLQGDSGGLSQWPGNADDPQNGDTGNAWIYMGYLSGLGNQCKRLPRDSEKSRGCHRIKGGAYEQSEICTERGDPGLF